MQFLLSQSLHFLQRSEHLGLIGYVYFNEDILGRK